MHIQIITPHDPRRLALEQLIHRRFRDRYNADIQHFMPNLLHLQSRDGKDVAALGFRPAKEGRLFLEQYLTSPVEELLSVYTDQTVKRDSVVEVGNLADLCSGGARAAIVAVTAFLYGQGYRWVVFTGIPLLANAFYRLGLEPKPMVEADPQHLTPEQRQEWGRYYDAQPKVMYGDIQQGQATLEYHRQVLYPLWEVAEQQGREQRYR